MESLFRLLNDNIGVILTVFNLILVAVISRRDRATTSALEAKDSALTAKDATIELLRAQNETFARNIASYEAKQGVADEHNKLTDETISILHKRISELECNQFLEHDGKGHVVLKSQIAKMVR